MNHPRRSIAVGLGILIGLWLLSTSASASPREPNFEYISPRPGARLVSPQTTIAVRPGDLLGETGLASGLFAVRGSASGQHRGAVVLADDRRTVIFRPERAFAPGESVQVTLRPGPRTAAGARLGGLSFEFTISATPPLPAALVAQIDALYEAPTPRPAGWPTDSTDLAAQPGGRWADYVTLPSDIPGITVTVPASGTAEGLLFLTACSWPDTSVVAPYALIVDDSGELVFYRRQAPGVHMFDFKKQPNGLITYFDRGSSVVHALDNSYTEATTYQAGNGYRTNPHDFQVLPDGRQHYLIYDPQQIDMSQIAPGGLVTATVVGLIVQEQDPSRNVVFEWRSWDHFAITDTVVSLTDPLIDYVHGNAVAEDLDGHLLISSRHLNEVTKINRQTGQVIWRWGGKRSQISTVNDSRPFSHLHDIRVLPNGHYTLFDNGNLLTPEYSRALEYTLDPVARTAAVVWEYRDTPDQYGYGMGSMQRLPNGHSLIGWGTTHPTMVEVTPQGAKTVELALSPLHYSYRAFRFPWRGEPAWPPQAAVRTVGETTTLHVSWNGATEIASYEVYAGRSPAASTLIATANRAGFETSVDISAALSQFCYFRTMPLNRQGQATRFSNVVRVNGPACPPVYLPLLLRQTGAS